MTRVRDYADAGDEPGPVAQPLLPDAETPNAPAVSQPFAGIYHEHARLLRLIAVRDFRVPFGDAESIVHDIFTRYFTNPGIVRGELKPYFRGAVPNECLAGSANAVEKNCHGRSAVKLNTA